MNEETKARIEANRKDREASIRLSAQQDNPALAAAHILDTSHAGAAAAVDAQNKLLTRAVSVTGLAAPKVATVEELEADPLKRLRIFRSRIPGSAFVMSEGYTIYFLNGWFETSDHSEIRQLEAVANKVPTIYTDEAEVEIVAALIAARKEGFVGSIAEAMAQQLTAEQRIAALRVTRGGAGNAPTLKLPSVLPPSGDPQGNAGANATTAADAANMTASLQKAIRSNVAQSNSK